MDHEKIWLDYLEFADSYKNELTVQEFAGLVIMFAAKMLCDVAPNPKEACEIIQAASEEGLNWSLEEKHGKP